MNLVERDIFKKSDGKTVFFVARVCHERQKVALIDQGSWFNQKSQYKKPVIYSFKDIKSQLNSGKLIADGCLQLPAMMLKTEKWLENTNKDKWLFQRDKNYRIIKSIVEDEDIFEICRKNSKEKAVELCVEKAKENGGDDNITAVIIQVS